MNSVRDISSLVAQRLLIWSLRTVGAENAAGQRECRLPGGRSSAGAEHSAVSAQRGRWQIGAPQSGSQHRARRWRQRQQQRRRPDGTARDR
jgi:hypothetical protein